MTGLMSYSYTCQELRGAADLTAQTTGANSDGGGNIEFLDRHPVACAQGAALRRFRLETLSSTMYYNYTCATVPGLGACTNRTTSPGQSYQQYQADYLDRVPVACLGGEVLSYFQHKFASNLMTIA